MGLTPDFSNQLNSTQLYAAHSGISIGSPLLIYDSANGKGFTVQPTCWLIYVLSK